MVLLPFQVWSQTRTEQLEQRLFDLPDVSFKAIDAPRGAQAAYELRIRQPIDHTNPSLGYFHQRVFLTHIGYDRPMVMVTEGYSRDRNRLTEVAALVGGNQLDIEHRFFGESTPRNKDYQYLTLEQATADLHHINEIFRQLYEGPFISTGISKGGQTTIFYRYFYPEDVAVSIPYVAPLNLSLEDPRIYTFLDTVGSDECRASVMAIQRRLLKEREEVLSRLKYFAKGAKLSFTYLSLEEAFEYAVLEYSFSFWQWGADCAKIPPADAPLEVVLDHFLDVSGIDFFSDKDMKAYASHYYQAATQMGYYGYETEDFADLLKALPVSPHPLATFAPDKMPTEFDDALVQKVYKWTQKKGDRIIYINGGGDTWSATAIPESDKVDSYWFTLAGKDHGAARIRNMKTKDRAKLISILEEWLEIELR